jgi:hypothetical protein
MTEKPKRRHSGPHRPGYRHPNRQGKHALVLYFTDAEFEAVTQRVQQDRTTKQEAGRRSLLDYAKRGMTNG